MTEQLRILVVEDEIAVLDIIRRELDHSGMIFAGGARTGKDAIELARSAGPDLILMDVHLEGDMDGIATARAIREFADVPVVFATGDAMDETIDAAVKTGPYGYLTKPFDPRELRSTIQVAWHKHQFDRRLAESEARYRTLTEAIPQKVWTSDHSGRAQFFNAEWVRYTGLSLERGRRDGWLAALHPLDAVAFVGQWEHAVSAGLPFERECRLTRAGDGEQRWHLARAVPLTGGDGQRQWFGTFTDIEDEKRREAQLKLSEAQKRAVLEASLDAIVTLDHDGRVLEFNPAAERIFGVPRYEAMGMAFMDAMLAPASAAAVQQQFKDHLTAVGDRFLGHRESVTGRRADGTEFPLEIGFTRVPAVGQPVFTAYGRDLSDRQRESGAHSQLEREHNALLSRHRAVLGHVPTCSACQAMQLPDGSWGDLDRFLREQGPAPKQEHLCPSCDAKLHPEHAEKKRFRLWSKEI